MTLQTLAVKGGAIGQEMAGNLAESSEFFYVPQICDMGPDGFTSPPKEGVLRNFFRPEKSDGFGQV
jgi:hypothetical protein